MSVPAEKWHKTLQYEGGDVTGIPGEFLYPERGTGRVFIPAVSARKAPSEHEVLTALRLAESGTDVLFRVDSHDVGAKNPDAEMNQQIWEFKAPTGATDNTISDQFKRAGKQAQRLVLDLRRSGMDDAQGLAQAGRRFAGKSKITDLIVITKDARIHRFSN